MPGLSGIQGRRKNSGPSNGTVAWVEGRARVGGPRTGWQGHLMITTICSFIGGTSYLTLGVTWSLTSWGSSNTCPKSQSGSRAGVVTLVWGPEALSSPWHVGLPLWPRWAKVTWVLGSSLWNCRMCLTFLPSSLLSLLKKQIATDILLTMTSQWQWARITQITLLHSSQSPSPVRTSGSSCCLWL